jgi:hypothetical protein
MHGSRQFHEILDMLCGITEPSVLKQGKTYIYAHSKPQSSDEADTVMFAAIIRQGEAQHALRMLDALERLHNPRERRICRTASNGMDIECYALRHVPESITIYADDVQIVDVDGSGISLQEMRDSFIKAICHGVRKFTIALDTGLEFRSGNARDIDYVSSSIPKELLRHMGAGTVPQKKDTA